MARQLANPPLFPGFVAQHTLGFDVNDETSLADELAGMTLPASLNRAVRKRQLEFLAGRCCARAAMRRCAPELAETAVGIGAQREPLWPVGLVGAITHTGGFVSVAVARSTQARGIGLDAEQFMSEEQARDIVEHIADRAELAAIARVTGWNPAVALTAIFSAKEAIFKALFPEVRRYFDFREAWLEGFELGSGTYRARLLSELTPGLPSGQVLSGRFAFDGELVCTGIVVLP